MNNRRRTERLFDYVVLGALVFIFVAILEVMSRKDVRPEVLTVLGGSLGVVLTLIGAAATHLWGSPKKDGPSDPAFTATVSSTTPLPPTAAPNPPAKEQAA